MKYDSKILRDFVLGDGYLIKPCGQNGGSGFRCTHGIDQLGWIAFKKRVFEKLGFKVTHKEYDNRNQNIYTQTTQSFRKFYDRWYHEGSHGRMMKNYRNLLQDEIFDETSFAILFLDNGHSEIKKTRIHCVTREKVRVNPFYDNFTISCPYQDSNLLAERISALGIVCKALRPMELRSRVAIYRVSEKQKVVAILKKYCIENGLQNVFSYKYDLPVTSRSERLNERTSANGRGCDSLDSVNNLIDEGGEGDPKRLPRK